MIDATPRALPPGQQRGGRTPFPLLGWKAILFGLPFAGVGALIALVLAPRAQPGRDAPAGLLQAIGAFFFAMGAWVVLLGLRSYWREWRRTERLERHRSDPWHADFGWNPRGTSGDLGRRAGFEFLSSAGLATVLVLFSYIAFVYLDPRRDGKGVWFARSGIALFDVGAAASFGYSAYLLARRLKYGRTFLRFGRFPFLLGETGDLSLVPPRRARSLGELDVTLRCVEERIETVKQGGTTTVHVVRWQMWADARRVTAGQLAGGGLALSFDLPADPRLGTELSATPPRYWELSVTGEAPGVDFASTFLVPVYASPGAGP